MFTVLGFTITSSHLRLAGIGICFLVAAWGLVLLQEATFRKVKSIDKKQMLTDIGSATAKAIDTAGVLATELTPKAQFGFHSMIGLLSAHFSFHGTASRMQFILTQVFGGLALGLFMGMGLSLANSHNSLVHFTGVSIAFVALIVTFWLVWAVSSRRVRDTGVTVWWVLVLLIPPVNIAAFVFLLLVPSNEFDGRGL